MNGKVFFEWSDSMSMSVGIGAINAQHKILIDILNRLSIAIVNGEDKTVTIEVLEALVDYSRTHFDLEERLMLDSNYDPEEYSAHCASHQKSIEEIDNAVRKYWGEKKSVSFELITFLKHWLSNHILVTDQKYAKALLENSFPAQAWEDSANNQISKKLQSSIRAKKHWWGRW